MTLEEYIREQQAKYADFAKTVAAIVDAALKARSDVPRPQQLQDRAKSEASLRRKLESRQLLASTTIETAVKDLAGCRLIFYTNTDVDRFLQSRIIFENFVIDQDNTRVHQPVGENVPAERLYRAIHYVVSLKPERLALPENSRFAGLRCEIQIQTTLNHAWSETSHDILYKRPLSPGFGAKQFEAIERRFARIMTNFLLPAGYEFQKIKHDFERLMQGKELFDRGVIEELEKAADNNERWDLLKRIRDNVIPHYDDIAGVFPELRRALVKAVKDGRTTALRPVETVFGNFAGHTAQDVADAALDVLEQLRYVDVDAAFAALCEVYPGAGNDTEKKRIEDAVDRLAEHDIHVWQKVGPSVQAALVAAAGAFDADQRAALRPVVVATCRHALEPNVSGTSSSLDTVTFHRGAVRVSDMLTSVRGKAIELLEVLYREADTEEKMRSAFQAMLAATQTPSAGEYGEDLCKVVLQNTHKIVEFFAAIAGGESHEILQHVENSFLWLYRRSNGMATRFPALQPDVDALNTGILRFRDTINGNREFVIHKTLVGFESVFPVHWESEAADYQERDAFRAQQIEVLVAEVSDANAEEWLRIIKRCAATRSNDLATFPTLIEFLKRLAANKPTIVLRYLEDAREDLVGFLPAFLEGLEQSSEQERTRVLVRRWIAEGRLLRQIARRLRLAREADPDDIRSLSARALEIQDVPAVIEIAVVVVARAELAGMPLVDDVFLPAMQFLTERKDPRWLNDAWFQRTSRNFFGRLTEQQARVVLSNLVYWPRVDHHLEQIFGAIAGPHYDLAWTFFRDRLVHAAEAKNERRYEAIPFEFHDRARPLSGHPDRAVDIVRGWHDAGDPLFRYHGGRLLAIGFPDMPDAFQRKLLSLLDADGERAFDFVVGILQNYHGQPFTHALCQALVEAVPENDPRLDHIQVALMSEGVVSGEFGMVEAYQAKKTAVTPWLDDARPKVRAFAQSYVHSLDNRIASEQRQAEERQALRRLDFEGDGEAA